MSLLSFLKEVFSFANHMDTTIKTGFKFSKEEVREIVSTSKPENLKYFETLAKMPNLKTFDISFLLSKTNLDDEKIEIIKKAQELYKEEEFQAHGQTCSDFIFRVGANLEYLNMNNIEIFKELVKCKNELYDFKKALQNPMHYLNHHEAKTGYAFERIYY